MCIHREYILPFCEFILLLSDEKRLTLVMTRNAAWHRVNGIQGEWGNKGEAKKKPNTTENQIRNTEICDGNTRR